MLSKRKTTMAVVAWIGEQLSDIQGRGASLVDEACGDSIRIGNVRQSGSLLFIDVVSVDNLTDQADRFELCVKVNQQIEVRPAVPSQSELSDIDGTA